MSHFHALLTHLENGPPPNDKEIVLGLQNLYDAARVAVQPIVHDLQQLITSLGGLDLEDFTRHRRIANALQQLLVITSTRIQCPVCGSPALLQHARVGAAKHGMFRLRHVTRGQVRPCLSSCAIPNDLRIIPAPPDARRSLSPLS